MGLLQYKGFQCVWDGADQEGPLSTSCAALQLYSPNQKQPCLLELKGSHLGFSSDLILATALSSCLVYLCVLTSSRPRPLLSLISSPFVCWQHFMYMCLCVPPCCLWGGSWEEGKEGRGGGEGGGGAMAKFKADAERLFSWPWEVFAGSGYWEHENVRQTWTMKPSFIHSFILSISPPPLHCTLSKRFRMLQMGDLFIL